MRIFSSPTIVVGWLAGALLLSSTLVAAELRGLVPNNYEKAAAAEGRKLGIGSAVLEGPEKVEVLSHQTFTLVYTAGKVGVKPGGGIRIGLRHLSQWSLPQTKDPEAESYLAVKTERDQPVEIVVDFRRRYFHQYFAWHNMVEVVLPETGLAPGETLKITFGDTAGGSPGIRVQPFDESCFVFKIYVDAKGGGDYLPLTESPAIEVVAAEPYRLRMVMPSDAVADKPTWCIVRAEDRYGNPAVTYRGRVKLTSSDAAAALPGTYTFVEADRGVHRFEGIVFSTSENCTVSASDGTFRQTANPVRVTAERPEKLLLWGDLHGHTLFSDGRGTIEEFYDFAQRVAGLDFCAVSDHAFEIIDEMWEHSKLITNRVNRPGRFVTFHAYEWSGNTASGGDHNCYFLDDDPPLYRSTNYYTPANLQMYHGPDPMLETIADVFAKLNEHLRNKDVFCIPHYGGRSGNPAMHDPKVQRMIEIFSEHRRSEDWATKFLTRGYRLGIMASSDGHYGNPGHGYLKPSYDWDKQEIGMAALAVYAPRHTRASIFHSLYDRSVYATSGDRIILEFHADGHPMGAEYKTDKSPTLVIEAVGTAPITRVEIKKNSQIVHTVQPGETAVKLQWQDPEFKPGETSYYYVRIVQENNEEAISSPIWVN
jgi:uncharacterized protein DUF3604